MKSLSIKEKKRYTVDYFIKKFKAIPAKKWCEGTLSTGPAKCALGHCGVWTHEWPSEAIQLSRLLNNSVADINDGAILTYQQKSPKARILAALKDLKENK